MTLAEIKEAVRNGQRVFWSNQDYEVLVGDGHRSSRTDRNVKKDEWLICCSNGHKIGLTWADEITLNGKEEDFYVAVLDCRSN